MKLTLEIEVDYDPVLMHGDNPNSIEWFRDAVLLNPAKGNGLILHSNCIGDSLGPCRVTRIISGLPHSDPIRVGDWVRVKEGATRWMKGRGFWSDDWPSYIDGLSFVVVKDNTDLDGDECNFWLKNRWIEGIGVHPQFVEKTRV